MNPIISENKQTAQLLYENYQEELISKLYALKKRFELMYYGKAECTKYDKARAFTIALNAALYQANRVKSGTATLGWKNYPSGDGNKKIHFEEHSKASKQISSNISKLEKELDDLIG